MDLVWYPVAFLLPMVVVMFSGPECRRLVRDIWRHGWRNDR